MLARLLPLDGVGRGMVGGATRRPTTSCGATIGRDSACRELADPVCFVERLAGDAAAGKADT